VGRGSGLGLSQVLGLTQQSGGGVRIDTAPGQGTSVKIYLPRCDTPAAAAVAEDGSPPPRGDGLRCVLLVDDDAAVREVTAATLRDLGHGVVEAASGPEALEALDHRRDVALLLVDFAMPGMNGAEVSREAKRRRPDLPVLFVTGYADAEGLADAGAVRVLQKPYTDAQLALEVDALLRASKLREANSRAVIQ
jgi:CheY-like chemotaxis protein